MLSDGFKEDNSGKKKHKPYRRKIRWEIFGLPAPEPTKPSIETIRSQVSSLAATRLAREPIPEQRKKPLTPKEPVRKRS